MLRNHLGMTHIMGQPSHGDFAILYVMWSLWSMVLRIQSWVEVQREKNDSSTWLLDSMVHKMSQAYSHQSYDVLN